MIAQELKLYNDGKIVSDINAEQPLYERELFEGSNQEDSNFSQDEIVVLHKKLDQIVERLSILELGQRITYDDLTDEFGELKELTKILAAQQLGKV